MLWTQYWHMTDEDLKSVSACPQTLTPVRNTVWTAAPTGTRRPSSARRLQPPRRAGARYDDERRTFTGYVGRLGVTAGVLFSPSSAT